MDQNDSVILVSAEMSGKKRKHSECDSSDYDVESTPKHPLLESVSSRFQQNKVEREKKLAVQNSKREAEKVHSNYLKQNVVDPHELAKASYAASYWAKKNGINDKVPSNTNSPGNAARLTKKQKQKLSKRQNNLPVSNYYSSGSCTATSASQASWQGTSNNDMSTPEESNVSIVSLRNKTGELTQTHTSDPTSNAKFICPIMYCETEFISEGSIGQHMNLFKHSPCNPLRLTEDTKLLPDPICYKCPECDIEFDTKDLCMEHMDKEDHLVFYPPLAIRGYLCPQCLHIFKTFQSCLTHMENVKHYNFKFPFKDDETDGEFNLPVALSEEFVQDYINECKKVAYQVQCLDCGMGIKSPAQFKHHQNETNNFHVMCALTDKVLSDVFIKYITTFSCDKCHRLFDKQPIGDSRHICAGGIVGNIKADLVRTTSEFLKSCAFTLISSVKVKNRDKVNQKPLVYTLEAESLGVERQKKKDIGVDINSPEQSQVIKKTEEKIPETYGSLKKEILTEPGYQDALQGHLSETLPSVSIKEERAVEPISQSRLKGDMPMLHHSSVKTEIMTEPMCKDAVISKNFHNGAVKTENTIEPRFVVEQNIPAALPHGSIKIETKPEPTYLNRVKGEIPETIPYEPIKEEFKIEPVCQYRVKSEGPSTSTGVVQGEYTTISEDSDSDIEIIERDVSQIVISDSDDLMILEDQDDIKLKTEMATMNSSPSKKKGKKKKKKKELTKKEIKEQRRLQEEAVARTACERRLKFIAKHEKKKENNPDSRQLPGRQAKSDANSILQRREKRAIEQLKLIEAKKAAKKEAAKVEIERRKNAKKEAVLREELRRKKQTSIIKQESENKVAETTTELLATEKLIASSGAGTKGKPHSSKQLENIRAEEALHDQDEDLISTENLKKMRNIIFLDLDNFSTFFRVLPHCPPDDMFVWAFYGGNFNVGRKTLNEIYFEMRQNGQVYISDRCGKTKDAADFALVLTVGKMDERLPPSVAFTIVSADKGFCEIERIMHNSSRSARVVNPKQDTDILLPVLRSIVEL